MPIKGDFPAFAFFLVVDFFSLFGVFLVSSGYCFAGCFHSLLNSDSILFYSVTSHSD